MVQGYIKNNSSNRKSVIVPDIHAREDFAIEVFNSYSPEEWDIVFLGDILHSENHPKRWQRIVDEFIKTNTFGADMLEEVTESHKTCLLIRGFQEKFPNSVFVLRGNHDDITERMIGPYGKFTRVGDSSLYAAALRKFFPDEYKDYVKYEKTIPYLYIGNGFVASHTVPIHVYTPEKVVCDKPVVHKDFTWTDNREQRGLWVSNFKQNIENLGLGQAKYWFIGHRPVDYNKTLRIQMNGRLVQNNHPNKWVVVEYNPSEMSYEAVRLCSPQQ